MNHSAFPTKLALILCCLPMFCTGNEAYAENWAFQRSYFTHALTEETAAITPEPYYRSAYRTPTKYNNDGVSVRSTYRVNRLFLQSGNSRDSQYIFEGSVEVRP